MSRSSYIQLTHTREWVPRNEAICESMTVYREFASNLGCVEDLVALSAMLRATDPEAAAKHLMNDPLLDRLTRRRYFTDSMGSLAMRTTLRSQVAMNMVVPEMDEDVISGYLTEPFIGREVFPEFHASHQKDIELRRRKSEQEPST